MAEEESIKVLFVCFGNICRSPMAEYMFKELVKNNHVANRFEILSKGTSGSELGCGMYQEAQDKLKEKGIPFSEHDVRKFSLVDFAYFDYIIAMDKKNVRDLVEMAPDGFDRKVHLLLDIDEGTKNRDVPDPWYSGDFDETYELLDFALDKWLDKFIKEDM
ncbi:MAG: low molecular weight protein-tyrosine-phosphatase [Acholeplasma sp.]|nr:low molecular weight protein-tyrosine-phosphatase [Acholeplasma sp.]